jgi:hypothetical protein
MFRLRPAPEAELALASSMQSFESSLFLLSLHRYPHAFVTAVVALESALKAHLAPTDTPKLQWLLAKARDGSESISEVPARLTDEVRAVRIRITHRGFSPSDDELVATLFLDAIVPLLAAAYRDFFGFELYDALDPDIAAQLQIAVLVSKPTNAAIRPPGTFCLILLGQRLRVWIEQSLRSDANAASADSAAAIGLTFDQVHERRNHLERELDPGWTTSCPACDAAELVCELAADALEAGSLVIRRGRCAACDLIVPEAASALLNEACRDDLVRDGPGVLRAYGIVPHGV